MDLPRENGVNLYKYATNGMFKDKNKNQSSVRAFMKEKANYVWAVKSHKRQQ